MKLDGPVSDAKKSVHITISPRDCKRGSTKDPSTCAAALACKRELQATDTRIHVGRSYLKIDGKWLRFRTSQALRSEIIAFDRGGEFKPGKYLLKTIPRKDEGIKRTKPKGTKDKRVKLKGKKRPYHVVTGVRETGHKTAA
jgi:hypothetical protein